MGGLAGNYRYGAVDKREPPRATNIMAVDPSVLGGFTIVDEISRPVIGANGVCMLGGADMRIAGAHKGERYRVRVLAVGVNQWTGRMEATVQKLAGPL